MIVVYSFSYFVEDISDEVYNFEEESFEMIVKLMFSVWDILGFLYVVNVILGLEKDF